MSEIPAFKTAGAFAFPVKRPVTVLMVTLAVVVFGWAAYQELPMSLMPDIEYPTLTVRTEYESAPPELVEDDVSRPIEQALANLEGLQRRSSLSRAQQSDVVLSFGWDADMNRVVLEVNEKLDRLRLPEGVKKPLILRFDPEAEPILRLALQATTWQGEETLLTLRDTAERVLERELEGMDGLAAIRVRGGLEMIIEVELIEARLQQYGISPQEVVTALQRGNFNMPAGLLRDGKIEYLVRTMNEFQSLEQIRDAPVVTRGQRQIRLDEIARVRRWHRERETITRVNGREAVEIEIYREADANIVDLARRVRERVFGTMQYQIARIQKELSDQEAEKAERRGTARRGRGGRGQRGQVSFGDAPAPSLRLEPPLTEKLPDGIECHLLSDQSVFIRSAVDDVKVAALLGGLLAVLIIFLFLANAKDTVIIAVSIPVSVIGTFFLMKNSAVSINIMSLGGLALGCGMLVDNSIVVIESIRRCLEEGDALAAACVRGTREVGGAVIASTLTTVCVFFPIGFIEGIGGQIFRDQALTVVYSLLFSLAVSLFLIPMLASRRLPERDAAQRLGFAAGLSRHFTRWQSVDAVRDTLKSWRWQDVFWLPFFVVGRLLHLIAEAIWKFTLFPLLALARIVVGTLALLVAWTLKALLFVPGLLVRGGFRALAAFYPEFLRATLAMRVGVLLLCAGAALLAVILAFTLGVELMPQMRQGSFTVELGLPPGSDLADTDRVAGVIQARFESRLDLEADPPPAGVSLRAGECARRLLDHVFMRVGVETGADAKAGEGEHTMKFTVSTSADAWGTRDEEHLQHLLEEAARVPGLDGEPEVTRPTPFSFEAPIEVHVVGYELQTLRRLGLQVEDRLRALPSLKNVRSNLRIGRPELHLTFDRAKLMRSGLTLDAVAATLRRKLQGEVATQFSDADDKVDILMRLRIEDRQSELDLKRLEVAPGFRLEDLVAPEGYTKLGGPSEIRREGNERAAVIVAEPAGLDLAGAIEDIERSLRAMEWPDRFHPRIAGQWQELQNTATSLFWAFCLSVFLVYVVMASQFESLAQPFVIMVTMPLALVGVVFTLWTAHMIFGLDLNLNVMVFLGVIVLMGIVVNNGIVLIDYTNQLRKRGLDAVEAVAQAGVTRLRPILMTTLTTVLALVPVTGAIPLDPLFDGVRTGLSALAANIREGAEADGGELSGQTRIVLLQIEDWARAIPQVTGQGLEMRLPMALTIIGGLSFATLLTLIVLPCVYVMLDGLMARMRTKAGDRAR